MSLAELPERLREAQALFDKTGGVHAAGLFKVDGASPELLCLREDVGRHNAVDKVVGWALRQNLLPLSGTVLQVSGRASFELVQKAAMAGIPVLSAVSAPSSLAADLAVETGVTLVGFSRGHSLNVYAGRERLARPAQVEPRGNLCPALTLSSPSSAQDPISVDRATAAVEGDEAGAVVSFSGVVRNHDGGMAVRQV